LDKSQLRRLALDFADGQIPGREYRARRRELIDGIIDGSEPIQREPRPTAVPRELTTVRLNLPPAAGSGFPWPLALGGASAVCVVVVAALLLWPADDPPPPAPSAPSVPAVGLSPARALVESFVARRNFAIEAVGDFEEQWDQLAQGDRDEARGSLWFGSLVRALRDEIKSQKALSGLAGGDAALLRARRIAALGEHLRIAEQLPDVDETSPQAGETAVTDTAGQAPESVAQAPPTEPAATASQADESTPATATVPSSETPTGREWLARQNETDLTLQLFAVNDLDRVEQLMAAHPDLVVRILATDGATPRYRVFHGIFTDEASARGAFDALPADLTGASGGAIVKSIAAVRDDLAGRAVAAPAPPTSRPASGTQDKGYTLQLFASGNRGNAEALIEAFPALPLQLRELNGDVAPFRVTYGRFDSEDSARAASSELPAQLLAKIGKPLAKRMTDTGNSIGR
jgi:septal ring-binding cell division protein DamX